LENQQSIEFNDSATVISALECGLGFTITRSSLVANALEKGTLVRPFLGEARDGLNYYAVESQHSTKNAVVRLFMNWLRPAFDNDFGRQ
jgi:DNA-binding transcriptional LysR family regulator